MSFIFPSHTYKNKSSVVKSIKPNFLDWGNDEGYEDENGNVQPFAQDPVKAAKAYERSIHKYSVFSWLWSFFPFSKAYNKRKIFVNHLDKWSKHHALDTFNGPQFEHVLKRSVLNPSWGKIALIVILTLLMLAVALTGIGALVELGVLGSFFTFGVLAIIGKFTVGTFAYVASSLSLSTATFTLISTTVAGFLASFFIHELHSPMQFLHDIFFSDRVQTNQAMSFKQWLITMPLLSSLFKWDFDEAEIRLQQHWFRDSVNLFLNPIKLITATLDFVEFTLDRIIETGATSDTASAMPRVILKGFVHGVFELLRMPLSVLETIADIPFLVLKGICSIPSIILTHGKANDAKDDVPKGLLGGNPANEHVYRDNRYQGLGGPQPQSNFESYGHDPKTQHGNVFVEIPYQLKVEQSASIYVAPINSK